MIILRTGSLGIKRVMRHSYPDGIKGEWHIMNDSFKNLAHCNKYFSDTKNMEEGTLATVEGRLCAICWPFGYVSKPSE